MFGRKDPNRPDNWPFSGLSPMELMNIIYCLYFRDSSNLEGQVTIFISPRNRVAQLYNMGLDVPSFSLRYCDRTPDWGN
jgi:hypothetical protein